MRYLKQQLKQSNNKLAKKIMFFHKIFRNKSFFEILLDINEGKYDVLLFESLGNKNVEKNIYVMDFDNSEWGFFAYWIRGLVGLSFAEKHDLTPVIIWTENSPYYEKAGISGEFNPFEYYYKQVADVSVADALQSKSVAFYKKFFGNNTIESISYGSEKNIEDFANLAKKFYQLKEPVKERIEKDINELLCGKKTLAVQIRGVEWGQVKGHPIPLSLETYIDEINKALEIEGFEQIFLATDSDETVEFVSNKFPNKVVVYSDVARAPKGSKTLAIFDSSIKRENNAYLLGYEVLRDMHTLAISDGLIASYSNISIAAEITKKSCGNNYSYKKILSTKINTKGISTHKAVEKMKNNQFN